MEYNFPISVLLDVIQAPRPNHSTTYTALYYIRAAGPCGLNYKNAHHLRVVFPLDLTINVECWDPFSSKYKRPRITFFFLFQMRKSLELNFPIFECEGKREISPHLRRSGHEL